MNSIIDDVVVVIPRYSEKLTDDEMISLMQCKKVLGKYKIIFMIPERLKYLSDKEGILVECFEDKWFDSVIMYSNLLLKKEFYSRFMKYKYMLIYQLDAFVFEDKLLYFCNLGFDYIGAAIPYYWFSETYNYMEHMAGYVGNGGFSLRKISAMVNAADYVDEVYGIAGVSEDEYIAEDRVFAFMGINEGFDLSVPSLEVAEKFAIDHDVAGSFCRIGISNLPFGVHGWNKSHRRGFWAKYINDNHEQIHSDINKFDYKNEYFEKWNKQIYARFLLNKLRTDDSGVCGILSEYTDREYVIWGCGIRGNKCYKLLEKLGINVEFFWDKNLKSIISGKNASEPFTYNSNEKKPFIIVTPRQGIDKIIVELEKNDYKEYEDYILFEDFAIRIVEEYYGKSIWNLYLENYIGEELAKNELYNGAG
ncbi:DUF5672 family protein [Butyrivibrio sp. MB2005]|uniref:DUF5672 family protein n=1 Tax=Butyrivibrio sp. MB2005 TaxID=1280678 RepID=UPI00041474A4|nr:DUF5672 family protein [Butyrivibrio sp. MB2005]